MQEITGAQGEVKIYTTPWCPYCVRAKRLLDKKGVDYQDVNVAVKPQLRAQLLELTGRTSVPQIFIHGKGIGGCDELHALDARGQLDPLLEGVPVS